MKAKQNENVAKLKRTYYYVLTERLMEIVNGNKKYKTDGQLIFSCQYHVIFCTKYRRSVLTEEMGKRVKEIINEKQTEYDFNVIEMEVMPNHVHLLLDVNPKKGVYSIVSKLKGCTSFVLREEFPSLKSRLPCLWTRSRFISSVGTVTLEVVKQYIEEQKNK